MATLAELRAKKAQYDAAEDLILEQGESFTIDGDTFTSANLPALQRKITHLENRIAILKRGGGFARSAYVGRG